MILGSVHVRHALLEFHADPESPVQISEMKPDRRIILYCRTGVRRRGLAGRRLRGTEGGQRGMMRATSAAKKKPGIAGLLGRMSVPTKSP
jgi:rhodanese-related sulfurtransferase